jgi:hypothetical protein
MKASLAVIASLFVSPAHAFENLIIDSIFQYPVELTDKATSWSDVQLAGPTQGTNAAAQRQNSFAVPSFPAAPNFPAVPNLLPGPNLIAVPNFPAVPNLLPGPNLLPVPNPLVSASPLNQDTQAKLPGNFSDSQLATSSSNAPQMLSNGPGASATQTSAPSSVSTIAAATQTLAASSVSPTAVATQTLAASISPAAPTSAASSVSAPAQTLAASGVSPTMVASQTSAASGASPNRPELAHAFSGNAENSGSRGGSASGPNGGVLGRVAAAIDAAFDASLTSGGETGGGARNPNGGRGVHGAPGPVAGVGLPSLILFGGIAYLVVRRRATPVLRQ